MAAVVTVVASTVHVSTGKLEAAGGLGWVVIIAAADRRVFIKWGQLQNLLLNPDAAGLPI